MGYLIFRVEKLLLNSGGIPDFRSFAAPDPSRKKEPWKTWRRYILRASFAQEGRRTYLPEPIVSLKVERESRIICRSKDNRPEKILQFLGSAGGQTLSCHRPGRTHDPLF
jgi:hypothetical protein